MAIGLIRDFDPAVVVGLGGYPSLPSLLAAGAPRRPRVLHEQNAVLGRVTRTMAPRVDAVAVASHNHQRSSVGHDLKNTIPGNPARAALTTPQDNGSPHLPRDDPKSHR